MQIATLGGRAGIKTYEIFAMFIIIALPGCGAYEMQDPKKKGTRLGCPFCIG